ncbi:MAG: TldD/PmbA family protein [Candidatus Thorarchaeota archaeon]|jgi:PmbA protein
MELSDIANKLVAKSESAGASQSEAYAVLAKTSSIYIDDNIPKIADVKEEVGVGIKVIIGKKISFTSSTLLSESVDDVVERAMSMAKVSAEDAKFVALPDPKKPTGPPDRFYDRTTGEADSDVLLKKTMTLVSSAVSDNVSVPNGVLRSSSSDFHITNSLGADAGSKSTIVFGYFTAKAEESGSVGEGVQRCWSRNLDDIDFAGVGEKLRHQALDVIQATGFKENWKDVVAVLAPSEGSAMLGSMVGFAVSAENVNNRSSPWTDKVGDLVAHESVTITDNGLSEKGLLSAVVDDEGTPMQTTPILDKGVLKSYLYDSYNAAQVDLSSTGNGIRRSPRDAQGSFSSPARCSSTTLEVPAHTKSVDDIIGEVKRGVYIEHFAWPQVDEFAGTFSNEIRNAQLIENGELTTKIKYALLVGNLYEAIKSEVVFGSDMEVHGSRVMPTFAISGTEIVGQ